MYKDSFCLREILYTSNFAKIVLIDSGLRMKNYLNSGNVLQKLNAWELNEQYKIMNSYFHRFKKIYISILFRYTKYYFSYHNVFLYCYKNEGHIIDCQNYF